jgi:hypothetical protein
VVGDDTDESPSSVVGVFGVCGVIAGFWDVMSFDAEGD